MKHFTHIGLALWLGLLTACTAEKAAQAECGAILQERCSACHEADWTCRKLGARNRERWLATIDRMVKHGAELSVAEKTALLDCLDRRQQEVLAACADSAAGQGALRAGN
jgi:hypothetical protein